MRARIRFPKRNSTVFCSRSRCAIPARTKNGKCWSGITARSVNLLDDAKIQPLAAELLQSARDEIRAIRVEADLYGYILDLVRRTREWPMLALGASPRAAICLLRVAQAFAAFEDRDYVIPDDVKRAVLPVLRHRILLKPEAELEGFDADRVLNDVVAAVAVPRASVA